MKKLIIASVIGAIALSGCAQNTHAYPDTYRSVEELRDAFVQAGGDCPNWEQSNQVKLAAESGTCSSTNVLSIYTSSASKDEVIATLKSLGMEGLSLLAGDNWIINDPEVKNLDTAIGGVLVTS